MKSNKMIRDVQILSKETDEEDQKAQNTKISSKAWEFLRWAKFELNEKTYSRTILALHKRIQDPSRSLQNTLKHFDKNRHRIDAKTPDISPKPKTVLLEPEAHKIISRIKLESNIPAYTLSDAIEFLIKENKDIWQHIPDRLKV